MARVGGRTRRAGPETVGGGRHHLCQNCRGTGVRRMANSPLDVVPRGLRRYSNVVVLEGVSEENGTRGDGDPEQDSSETFCHKERRTLGGSLVMVWESQSLLILS